jgi:hypothetical protein
MSSANATFSAVTIWPFLLLLAIIVAGLSMFARYNIQFTIRNKKKIGENFEISKEKKN